MKGITPMEIGETPHVQDDVLAVGYPRGGEDISYTKEPSTVRSGISNTLYDMKTPSAIIPQIIPRTTAPGSVAR